MEEGHPGGPGLVPPVPSVARHPGFSAPGLWSLLCSGLNAQHASLQLSLRPWVPVRKALQLCQAVMLEPITEDVLRRQEHGARSKSVSQGIGLISVY